MALHVGPLKITTGAFLLLAMVSQIVSLASHFWLTFKIPSFSTSTSVGLWKTCYDGPRGPTVCTDLPSEYVDDNLKAARGLIIFSVLLTVVSAGFIGATVLTYRSNLLLGAAGILLIQAILQGGGVGSASKSIDGRKDNPFASAFAYGWSLYVGAVAAGLYAIAGAFSLAAIKERRNKYTEL